MAAIVLGADTAAPLACDRAQAKPVTLEAWRRRGIGARIREQTSRVNLDLLSRRRPRPASRRGEAWVGGARPHSGEGPGAPSLPGPGQPAPAPQEAMMPFRFCFKLPDGKEHCVDIPVLVNQFPPVGPDPGPWLTGLRPDISRDLLTLGRIQVLSATLGAELRPAFDAGFTRAAETLRTKLPKGVTLELSQAKAAH
ncbi:MAG: hypothetical protein ACOYOH_14840 [Paracraurococcus sp.]